MLATVMAQAPASSWRWKILGAIVVLPWGANKNPWSAAYCFMTARLFSRAASFTSIAGSAISPRAAFVPIGARAGRRDRGRRRHLSAVSAITASISMSYPRMPTPTVVRAGIGSSKYSR